MGNILVVLIVAGIIAGAIRKIYKDKKSGKSSCGCGCSGCSKHDSCS